MNPQDYHAPHAGRIVQIAQGGCAFVPAPLPPRIEYTAALVGRLSRADQALSELSGLGRYLPNPHLLIAPYVRREAVLSTRDPELRYTSLYLYISNKCERRRKRKVVRTGKQRQRQIGGGAQFANDLADRLLMLLLYYRLYLTQELMTLLFTAENKSVICRSIQKMRPVFESVLPMPERARQRLLSLADKEQNQPCTIQAHLRKRGFRYRPISVACTSGLTSGAKSNRQTLCGLKLGTASLMS